MLINRVMPCLLLKDGGLVKTVQFRNPGYIGDPINAIRIYNEKEVDELIFLDISATIERRSPPYHVLSKIASECFMPVTYGGGIRTLEEIHEVFRLGIEKVAINTHAADDPEFVRNAAGKYGSQSIVISIDVCRKRDGQYEVMVEGGRRGIKKHPVAYAKEMEACGAGEILLTAIDREGTYRGYDIELLSTVTRAVGIPVIANGGAGKVGDFGEAVKCGGASACAAGSMVVYFGRNKAVLINYPDRHELESVLT